IFSRLQRNDLIAAVHVGVGSIESLKRALSPAKTGEENLDLRARNRIAVFVHDDAGNHLDDRQAEINAPPFPLRQLNSCRRVAATIRSVERELKSVFRGADLISSSRQIAE